MKRFATSLLAAVALVAAWAADTDSLWLGGDISMLLALQRSGAVYRDSSGRTINPYDLFAQQGWNMMRVRLFVDPQNAPSRHHDEGVCQDLDYVVDLCRTIRERGFEVMLDFHYLHTSLSRAPQSGGCRTGDDSGWQRNHQRNGLARGAHRPHEG